MSAGTENVDIKGRIDQLTSVARSNAAAQGCGDSAAATDLICAAALILLEMGLPAEVILADGAMHAVDTCEALWGVAKAGQHD